MTLPQQEIAAEYQAGYHEGAEHSHEQTSRVPLFFFFEWDGLGFELIQYVHVRGCVKTKLRLRAYCGRGSAQVLDQSRQEFLFGGSAAGERSPLGAGCAVRASFNLGVD